MPLGSDQATALLVQLYASVLGRQPDASALALLVPQLAAGADPGIIRLQLATGSLEATYRIDAMDRDVLGRGADLPSLNLLLAGLANGSLTLASIRAQLAAGSEAASAIGTQYFSVLGRHADPVGLGFFQAALVNGGTLADIRQALATSGEETSTLAATYQQVLGRPATATDLAADAAALASGQQSFFDVLHDIAYSPEATGDVTSLYRSLLGRAPSAAESNAASFGFEQHGSLANLRASLAAGPESQARLRAAYELNFGRVPTAATLSAQTAELAAGRPFADTTQVTARSLGGGGSLFAHDYGYAIPAPFSPTGQAQFLSIYNDSGKLYAGSLTTVPVPVTAATPGPDTIVLTVQTTSAAPLTFLATVDGNPVGSATVSAPAPTAPSVSSVQDQLTFTGNFGPGLHDLHIQLSTDPANALLIASGATFDGNAFLLGGLATDATGTADIFPHPGPQPAQLNA